ncbi:MAG: hypothetical protein ACE5KM_16065, partial [Planctomycetaceae bacterium]
PAESDLDKLSETALRKDVLSGIPFSYRTHWDPAEATRQVAVTQQNQLTRWLLVAVFCLLIVELLMAWRFSFGFAALYVLVAAELTHQTAAWNLATGILLGLALFAVPATVWQVRRTKQAAKGRFAR